MPVDILKRKKKKKLKKSRLKKKSPHLSYFFLSSKLGKKLCSYLIRSGQKQKALSLWYKIFLQLKKLQPLKSPTVIIKKAIITSLPFYEMRSYKSRGRTLFATLPIYTKKRRLFLLFKFIKFYLKTLTQNYVSKYATLLVLISKKKGVFLKNLQKTTKLTLKQYPQLHFRWKS